ncbi:hypothetical protein FACS1894130_13560 [Spirochaetia bacterium]|nr:hypothetical protein FACS1894130_13560 [Spirochaetia bacterium]
MELGQEFSIKNSNNSIIVETNSKWGFKNTLELEYDKNTHRLIKLNDDRENPQFSYFYEYEYNESGRLEFVYRIYNNDKVLIKSIYYDGQSRIIPHPYIYDIHTSADREIIVYQNNVIKYYIEKHPQDSDHASSEILEKEEARYGLLTIEYDEYGNEIKQTLVREKSQYFDESIQLYEIQNVELDEKMNWIEQKVFWVIYGEHRLIGTYSRNIKYE